MKQAIVNFIHVRDCPFYCSGECMHPDCTDVENGCNESELSTPPTNCPLEDYV